MTEGNGTWLFCHKVQTVRAKGLSSRGMNSLTIVCKLKIELEVQAVDNTYNKRYYTRPRRAEGEIGEGWTRMDNNTSMQKKILLACNNVR